MKTINFVSIIYILPTDRFALILVDSCKAATAPLPLQGVHQTHPVGLITLCGACRVCEDLTPYRGVLQGSQVATGVCTLDERSKWVSFLKMRDMLQ